MEENKKESIWLKKLNLGFVYIFIFAVGIIIVLIMTTYLNNKVAEFTQSAVSESKN